MKRIIIFLISLSVIVTIAYPNNNRTLSAKSLSESDRFPHQKDFSDDHPLIQAVIFHELQRTIKYLSLQVYPSPKEWGLHVSGVKNRINTEEPIIALTLDACGSSTGNGFDGQLINFLIDNEIPATLFINERWITANEETFLFLAGIDLFQIENHGTHHKPLSIDGQKAYGINGTNSPSEVLEEVMTNYQKIYQITGKKPRYFRSGTAHYDEVSVSLLDNLGVEVVNFDINGDAGATYTANQVKNSLLQAQPGSIVILHMNQPNSGTAEGVAIAVPQLKDLGFEFVKLEDYELY
ncbi:polysaccharide deacetylase family protein [Aquibacillus halophilus]|uniref:Polysaccharide deacetylase family protein n=1 Tax=Aquibacillus halophilus TaxID=930132 RepID=A0A6A8DEC1_9BACI|nr:polysaccharide deacetylase family protein [Aquibacillus halophilus]MRH42121.1 polysaccharide deacetylase family protein [Aquibacillus halophilus]